MNIIRQLLVWVVIVCAFCIGALGLAQSDWQTMLYADFGAKSGFLLGVDAEGIHRIDLPETLYTSLVYESPDDIYYTADASLSPDGRWLAVAFGKQDGSSSTLLIADVQGGACCWTYQPLPTVYAFDLGDFDATSTRLSVAYVGEDAEPYVGGMAIIPAQIVEDSVIQNVPMNLNGTLAPEIGAGVWAIMGRWREDGIRFSPNCYACDGGFIGEYSIWNPDTNVFVAHSGEIFTGFGERLNMTGEMIVAANDPTYVSSDQIGMFPPSNVIRYSPSGAIEGPDSRVVFANPAILDIAEVRWVLDGNAVLISQTGVANWQLLYRDGTTRQIDYSGGHRFIAGTPDGWLTLSSDAAGGTSIWHWNESGGTQVGTFEGMMDVHVLNQTMIGVNMPQQPQVFPDVLPPNPDQLLTLQPPPSTCPGAPATRLVVGGQGRVTPGDPNRVRNQPTLSGSEIVGQIPGGELFTVLEGPSCEPSTGLIWWLVSYGNLTGWTAEGQGDTYFVEPAS
jgi:hypothetical protein